MEGVKNGFKQPEGILNETLIDKHKPGIGVLFICS